MAFEFNASKTRTGASPLDGRTAQQLRQHFKGRVLYPGEPGYDEARTVFYGGFDRRPAVIIQAAGVEDVIAAVTLARETGAELSVRSGGHSNAGYGVTEGGVMLDLSRMRAFEIDPVQRTAWVEPGLTAGELTAAADKYDLALGFGDTGSVGIGGITTGGGVGYLSRKYGLTIDSLLSVDVVTAGGQLRRADAQNDADLFWAIRGGGGNFGVVTRLEFRLHPLGQVFGGHLILPAVPEVITGFIQQASAAPDELSTIANVMPAPPLPFLPAELHGKMVLWATMVYAGDVEAGQRAAAPFRALAEPLADMLHPMRYPELFPDEGGYHPTAVAHTMFVDRIGMDEARTILKFLSESDAVMRAAQLRVLGGAVARVPADATAYAHRQAPIMVNLAAFYTTPEDRAIREAWVAAFAADLRTGDWGAYSNFLADEGPERVRAAYPGSTWDRLRAVKTRYDAGNLFHLNQNIPPG